MKKDFDTWNRRKKIIHERERVPYFHEREIWWCSLGMNIGFEQDGGEKFERPMLIIKKFNQEIFWALPLTRSGKRNKYYFFLSRKESSTVILSQLRLVSAKRLERLMYKLSKKEFKSILSQVKNFFPKV